MKIFNSRRSIVWACVGVLFAALVLVSCEKREDLDSVKNTQYSKSIAFSQVVNATRSVVADYTQSLPNTTFVLRNIEENQDSLFLMTYVTDFDDELLTRATTYDNEDVFGNDGFSIFAIANGSELNNLTGTVVKKDDTWHYSPDDKNWSELGNNSVQFYAYDNCFATSNDNTYRITRSATSLNVVMPTNSDNQTDVVVAKSNSVYNSSSNAVVPLTFNHIFAGVKFEIGDLNQEVGGYVSAITIDGMYGSATYNMATNSWTGLDASNTKTFTVGDIKTNNQTKGSKIGSTLMVIPGQLSAAAKINITFVTASNKTRTLSASLAGGNFEAGKLYTCKINTNKIEKLSFVDVPKYIDAHYVITSVKVYLDQTTSSATLTAKIGSTNVEMTKELNPYEERGYWIDNTSLSAVGMTKHKSGSITLSGSGEHIVYLFVPENVSAANRSVSLSLSASGADTKKDSISQFYPTSTGCERIEEDPYQPWGPYWEFPPNATNEVVYHIDPNSEGYADLKRYMFYMYVNPLTKWFFTELLGFSTVEGVTPEGSGSEWLNSRYTLESVKVDYTKYLSYDTDGTGLENTQTVFNGSEGVNISQLVEIEEMLGDAVLKDDSGNPIVSNEPVKKDFENSAIIGAVKKNRFTLSESEGVIVLACPNTAIKWHLPSISDIPTVLQYKGEPGETLIDGTYWSSSTSTGDNLANSHSKVYTWPSGPSEDKKRNEATYKFRAVRVSGSDTQFQNQ